MVFYVDAAKSPFIINIKNGNTELLALENIYIIVDSSAGPVSLLLPLTSDLTKRNASIYIQDATGHANINNISISASGSDTVNGASSITINTAKGFQWCHITSKTMWSAVAAANGGGGTALQVSMTYAQLIANIGANTLVPGQQILLTDYHTSQYIPYSGTGGGGIGGEAVNVGPTEPLVLTAISNNTLSLVAQSLQHPEDVILYLPSVPDGNYEYAPVSGKGCIIYRRDQKRSIARDYDWRNVVFRRWETVIGNGLYYSYLPVVGAAHIDVNSFNGATTILNTTIKSPLGVVLEGLPTPAYWLDNTVIGHLYIADVILGYSYANTYTPLAADLATSKMISNLMSVDSYNVIVAITIEQNIIGFLGSNSVIGPSGDFFNSNSVLTFTGNTFTNAYDNSGNKIQNNTVRACFRNVFFQIKGNTSAGDISLNDVNEILNNSCTGGISQNEGNSIDNNSNTAITGNVVGIISTNSSGDTISANVASVIKNNTRRRVYTNILRSIIKS